MSFWVAGAVVVGAVASSRASSKAAKAGRKSSKEAGRRLTAAARTARDDVNREFPQARADLLEGSRRAFDLFNQGMAGQQDALSQGNLNAQDTVSRGYGNIRNALLGLPVNQRGFMPQGIDQFQPALNPFFSGTGAQRGGAFYPARDRINAARDAKYRRIMAASGYRGE